MTRDQVKRARAAFITLDDAMANVMERSSAYDDVRHEDLVYLRRAWQAFNASVWDHVTGDAFKGGETGRPPTVLDHPSLPDWPPKGRRVAAGT